MPSEPVGYAVWSQDITRANKRRNPKPKTLGSRPVAHPAAAFAHRGGRILMMCACEQATKISSMLPNDDPLSRLAFALFPELAAEAINAGNVEPLTQRMRDIQRGMSAEDELAAKVSWLGNSAGIHRIDQIPLAAIEIDGRMRAPDFIAFPIVNGRPYPVLIEVKSKHDQRLKFSDSYLTSLRLFADRLRLPLLIARKCGGLWTLFDHRRFQRGEKGHRITLGTALMEDLSCALFRDIRVMMNPDIELAINMELVDEIEVKESDLLPAGIYTWQLRGGGFFLHGNQITDYDASHFSLFLAMPDTTELRRTGARTWQHVIRPEPESGFNLSNVLVGQLSLMYSDEEDLNWHQILRRPFPSSGRELRQSIRSAIEKGFVQYGMDIVPHTWPDFVPKRTAPAGED